MNFRATRQAYNPFTNDKLGNFGPYTAYKLWENEILAGELDYKNIIPILRIDNQQLQIQKVDNGLFRKGWQIIDIETGLVHVRAHNSSWSLLFNNIIGKLIQDEHQFKVSYKKAHVMKSGLLSFYQTVSQGFRIDGEADTVVFSSVYSRPNTENNNIGPVTDFSCEIQSSTQNKILILTGLFLIERYFQG